MSVSGFLRISVERGANVRILKWARLWPRSSASIPAVSWFSSAHISLCQSACHIFKFLPFISPGGRANALFFSSPSYGPKGQFKDTRRPALDLKSKNRAQHLHLCGCRCYFTNLQHHIQLWLPHLNSHFKFPILTFIYLFFACFESVDLKGCRLPWARQIPVKKKAKTQTTDFTSQWKEFVLE